MQPNEQTRKFELVETERWALGLPPGVLEWPIDDPEGLLELAQREHSAANNLDLSQFYGGTARSDALNDQQRRIRSLENIIFKDLLQHMPSLADGAEEFLKQQD